MKTIIHKLETKECVVTIENKVRYYKMEITLKNGFMCIGYPQIWNRLKDAKEFIKNNYNN
jgi:small-conductance mechanosensitive channel